MSKANKLCVSLIVVGAFLSCMPRAQAQTDQQVSVADAARKSRELKKDAAKPATVITNDTLEPEKPAAPAAAAGVSGETNATNAAALTNLAVSSAPDASTGRGVAALPAANTGSNEPQDKSAQSADLKALKQQIAEKQMEVDLAERALALANDDFYSRPDFSKDDGGKAKLDAMKSDLAAKKDELAELKAKLPADVAAEEKPAAESQPSTQTSEQQSSSPSEPQQQMQPPPQPPR